MAEERRQAEEEARQAAVVQAERQRLLREAAHLKGHLPKGVLQSFEEMRLMEGSGGQYLPAPEQAPGLPGWQVGETGGWQGGAAGGWQHPTTLPASSQMGHAYGAPQWGGPGGRAGQAQW